MHGPQLEDNFRGVVFLEIFWLLIKKNKEPKLI